MKKILFFLGFVSLILSLTACESKESKAFDAALQSRKISQMKSFLNNFTEAGSLLIDSAKVILARWEQDSTDYASLCQMDDVVKRAGAEKSYMDNYPDGLHLDSVVVRYEHDGPLAAEIVAKEAAKNAKLEPYYKMFKNRVFYANPQNSIILTVPDDKGKGQGVIVEINSILPTFYDFHYSINLEDLDDDAIQCSMDKYNGTFTLELLDKTLYMQSKGETDSFDGEIDKDFYNNFMERVANINKGVEMYGNPKYRINISTE